MRFDRSRLTLGAYLNQMFSTRKCQISRGWGGLDPSLKHVGLTMSLLLETADLTQVSELKNKTDMLGFLLFFFFFLTVKCNSVCSNKDWCQEAERHREICSSLLYD